MRSLVVTLCLILVLVWAEEKSGLRWDLVETDGTLIRSLSDSERLVTLEYNNKSQLIQCWITEGSKAGDAISLMFYSAVSDSNAKRKDALPVDIDQIIKHCRKYNKKVFKSGDKQLMLEVETAELLRDGFDGTRWCGLIPSGSGGSKVALKKEDRCCKKWHQCDLTIQGHSYHHMTWNYRPYALHGCNCTAQLQKCLLSTQSEVGAEILEAQFENSNPKCLISERRKTHCVKWDTLYDSCVEFTEASYASVTTLGEYRSTGREQQDIKNEEERKAKEAKERLEEERRRQQEKEEKEQRKRDAIQAREKAEQEKLKAKAAQLEKGDVDPVPETNTSEKKNNSKTEL